MKRFGFKQIISLIAVIALLCSQAVFAASAADNTGSQTVYSGVSDDPEQFKYQSSNNKVIYDEENGRAQAEFSARAISTPYTPLDNSNLADFEKVEGIDVSQWQGEIDWKKVAADGVKFAIIRVGYRGYGSGKIGADETYAKNLRGALDAGLQVGVYFYTQAINTAEAEAEADYIINAIKGYNVTMPIVYDIESVDGDVGRLDAANLSKDKLTDLCMAFCAKVEKAGYKGMVYANKHWLTEKLDASRISAKYQTWIARYISADTRYTDYSGDYSIWQYTSDGRVNGINGKVDMNRMYRITPSKVQNLNASGITGDSITLTWDVSPKATNYSIEQYDSNGVKEKTYVSYTNSYKITGLTPSKSYVFKVTARSIFAGKILNAATASCFAGTTGAQPYITLNKNSQTVSQGMSFLLIATTQYNKNEITWSTSNSAVATVSNGIVTAKGDGTAIITASLDGSNVKATCIVTVQATSVKLAKSSMNIGVGERYTLTTSGTKPAGSLFTSSNPSVVSVSSTTGIISGNKAGTSTVTITAPSGAKSSCVITVKPAPTSVKLNKTAITLGLGETYDLNSTVSTGSSSYVRSYTSSNSSVATAPDSIIRTTRVGTATITVRTYNGKTAACKVTVLPAPTSVKLNKTAITLGVGETYDLNSSVNAGSASYVRHWTTSNSSVATVSSSIITAKRVGTAVITVRTYNGKTAACTVTVKSAPNSITLNKTSLMLTVGETYDLNSTVNSGSASYVRNYTSDNSSVATAPGSIVNAKKAGTATITVSTYNGVKTTCKVTVREGIAAPVSFKATNPSTRKISLSWSKVNGATGYELYRSKISSTSGYTKIKTQTGTAFDNTEMTKGTTYYYRVRAYRKVGNTTYYSGYKTVSIKVSK